ncbi:MAG TPA: ATP-dependent helicase [Clostridiales bacterium]|nr:ATP-dependent helicase [Clostridiales bacterium]
MVNFVLPYPRLLGDIMDNIKLSVRELVEFVYKSGDINSKAASAARALEGIKAHKFLQSQMGESYKKEFYLKREFELNDILFIIEGRADGIITENGETTVDEIKSTYTDLDLVEDGYNMAHIAQAKCYAYIYGLDNDLNELKVQLRYFNIDTGRTKTISYKYTMTELELFFYDLLNMYVDWAETIINLRKEREDTVEKLEFPFNEYREGQRKFSVAVFRTIQEGKHLFAQAPTGVGKTISVLFPAIKSLNYKNNSKIYYLTAKSSTKDIAFDTVKLMAEKGLKLRTTVITAKEKTCFMDEAKCEPEYCPYAMGYYDKLNTPLKRAIKNDCLYDRDYIENMGRTHEICPFELSLDLAYMSDAVICDYNYYFDPRVALQRDDVFKNNNDILLVDEAHNLEDRTRSMYSPELVKEEIYALYKIMQPINKKISRSLSDINKKFIEIKKSSDEPFIFDDEPSELINSLMKFAALAEEYINDKKNENVPDELVDIYFKSTFFIKISEIADNNFCYYADPAAKRTMVKLFLVDPSDILKEILKSAWSAVFFSATFTPLKYFRYMLGGEKDDYILKIKSPFEESNLKLMITENISMKYAVRDANIEASCRYINEVISRRLGNYMVFFPSYSFMEKTYEVYEQLYDTSNIIFQKQGIDEEEQKIITDKFKTETGVVLFTVVGGIFSEGIDLPLEKLIGAVIIGTGIPQISFERNIIRNFFDDKFNSGYDFAYKYPGFNKILQSAGRVIRTESDRGVVLLIDSRLCQMTYLRLFPDHWKHCIKIKSAEEIRNEISLFWRKIKMNIVSEKNVNNGRIISKEQLESLLYADNAKIYEVIRVINKRPVFLKEHFDRMKESINLSGTEGELNFDDYKNSVELLIDENEFENCNIRVSYYYNMGEVVLFYFIESHYPSEEQFKTGVHTVTAKVQRNNPNVKAFQKDFKERVQQIMDENSAFEAILINDDDTVSEGSRSNIFFVKGGRLVTSPDSAVLLGVTRSKVIEVCENNGIEVEKRVVDFKELDSFDGAFITGTSNDVLPIRTIDDRIYNSTENEVVSKAYELYINEVRKEIE